jgi:hypothetical protein
VEGRMIDVLPRLRQPVRTKRARFVRVGRNGHVMPYSREFDEEVLRLVWSTPEVHGKQPEETGAVLEALNVAIYDRRFSTQSSSATLRGAANTSKRSKSIRWPRAWCASRLRAIWAL